jgi:hypothetical protein
MYPILQYWQEDQSIMEISLRLNLYHSNINEINQCHLFLQVITISDIATTDGKFILPEVMEGTDIPYRTSALSWPRQNCPHSNTWRKWNNFLQHIHCNGALLVPLGARISTPHQCWNWYAHVEEPIIYFHHHDRDLWVQYLPVNLPNNYQRRVTRHHTTWYMVQYGQWTSLHSTRALYTLYSNLSPRT